MLYIEEQLIYIHESECPDWVTDTHSLRRGADGLYGSREYTIYDPLYQLLTSNGQIWKISKDINLYPAYRNHIIDTFHSYCAFSVQSISQSDTKLMVEEIVVRSKARH